MSLIFVIPGWTIAIRRLNDIQEPWQKVFYVLIPVYRTWLFCLLLIPTRNGLKTSQAESKKPFIKRRANSNPMATAIFVFIFPLFSLYFGIRQRSAVLALMPCSLAGFILKFKSLPLLFWGSDYPHLPAWKFVFWLLSCFAGALWAYKINENNRREALGIIP